MRDELYADAIGEITVTGTVVRIDLVSLSATQRDDTGQPAPEHRQRVIMSLEGFANSFDVLQKAMNGLIEAGAIHRTDTNAENIVVPAKGVQPNGTASRNGSPNFE
ncbi:hypothetical protein PSQ90_01795 [Devosia rhodophyticola]|uniref:Uncharacterized protein n=1 Tax=Devosia rhodophyticola TaxID=3026423 RepID=A0ABY7YZA5_9HYPH|nr:hypothetical protein [Devosia rhodophyticola]WDR06219.1 hypothetical protein PSQ90_01795 [Devosia rhodophyticola]